MGCGGYGRLFDIFEYYGHSRGGCGGHRERQSYHHDDLEETMLLLKRMYVDGVIDDDEYEMYKQRVLNGTMGFEEVKGIKMSRLNSNSFKAKEKTEYSKQNGAYKGKINSLKESRAKIEEVQNKLSTRIEELYAEKNKMESIAEEMLKLNETKAEEYIRRKLDILENIQNLEKRRNELQEQMQEINSIIKNLEIKELEEEALKLKEELYKTNL